MFVMSSLVHKCKMAHAETATVAALKSQRCSCPTYIHAGFAHVTRIHTCHSALFWTVAG